MTDESQGSDSGQVTDNENQEGSGSSHQGSDEDFKPPRDGSWIPRERLNTVSAKLDGATQRIGELEKKLEEADKPPQHTREELRAKVDAGEVTQAAYDEYFAAGDRNRVVSEISAELQQRDKNAAISAEVAEYEKAVPALQDTSSETYQRVVQEHNYMVNTLGQPSGAATVAMAARSVLGPLSSLRAKIPEANPGTHVETGGGTGDSPGGDQAPTLTWEKLDARRKDFYERQIRAGAIPDRAAAVKELAEYQKA